MITACNQDAQVEGSYKSSQQQNGTFVLGLRRVQDERGAGSSPQHDQSSLLWRQGLSAVVCHLRPTLQVQYP